MSKVFIFLAEGFEEVEALAVADVLIRAGSDVKLISISDNLLVKGAHCIEVKAKYLLENIVNEEFDLLFLPGGMPGTRNLGDSEKLKELIIKADKEGKLISAICAAPSVLGKLGLLKNRKATCYPGFEKDLIGAELLSEKVVKDGHIITSRGMGTAIDLGLKLTEIMYDKKTANEIAESIEYR